MDKNKTPTEQLKQIVQTEKNINLKLQESLKKLSAYLKKRSLSNTLNPNQNTKEKNELSKK